MFMNPTHRTAFNNNFASKFANDHDAINVIDASKFTPEWIPASISENFTEWGVMPCNETYEDIAHRLINEGSIFVDVKANRSYEQMKKATDTFGSHLPSIFTWRLVFSISLGAIEILFDTTLKHEKVIAFPLSEDDYIAGYRMGDGQHPLLKEFRQFIEYCNPIPFRNPNLLENQLIPTTYLSQKTKSLKFIPYKWYWLPVDITEEEISKWSQLGVIFEFSKESDPEATLLIDKLATKNKFEIYRKGSCADYIRKPHVQYTALIKDADAALNLYQRALISIRDSEVTIGLEAVDPSDISPSLRYYTYLYKGIQLWKFIIETRTLFTSDIQSLVKRAFNIPEVELVLPDATCHRVAEDITVY